MDDDFGRGGYVMPIGAIRHRDHQRRVGTDLLLRPGLNEHPVVRHEIRILEGERHRPTGLGLELLLDVIQGVAGLDLQDHRIRSAHFGLPSYGLSFRGLSDDMPMRLLGDGTIAAEFLVGLAEGVSGEQDGRGRARAKFDL